MAFKKAAAEQSAIKMGLYGPPGSGKTVSALLFAEGLAKQSGKKIAYVDTELGTRYYSKPSPGRTFHPEAFEFDALYTKSLTETLSNCRSIGPEYCVVVIDSISHLWDAAIAAYRGPLNGIGAIPGHAWGPIKRPYKELMHWALNCPQHVFILGRQTDEWVDNEKGEKSPGGGYKMRAEKETGHEPDLVGRMESVKQKVGKVVNNKAVAIPTVFFEKDRSSTHYGKLIQWPNFDSVIAPLLGLLGDTQTPVPDEEESAHEDADALAKQARDKHIQSNALAKILFAEIALATQAEDPKTVLNVIGEKIRVAKAAKRLSNWDLGQLRGAFEAATEGREFPSYKPEGGDAE